MAEATRWDFNHISYRRIEYFMRNKAVSCWMLLCTLVALFIAPVNAKADWGWGNYGMGDGAADPPPPPPGDPDNPWRMLPGTRVEPTPGAPRHPRAIELGWRGRINTLISGLRAYYLRF